MNLKTSLVSFVTVLALTPAAFASFHLMQVEQVIGGMDGNPLAQAIQLRMRAPGQNLVSATRVRVWNATGGQPVMVLNITADVPRFSQGSRILLATPAFITTVRATAPTFTPDFTMDYPIPSTYLAAGRMTFETDAGGILWSFAWGGGRYAGSNLGGIENDANGVYGPPFPLSLPTSGRQGVMFKGPAAALSTTNAADYILSSNPATVITNNGRAFVIGPRPEIAIVAPDGGNLLDGVSTRNFGSAEVGTSGNSKTFTIRSVGTLRLTGLKVTKGGRNPGNFSVTQLSETSLMPGESVKFKVTFKPLATGTRRAVIRIRSSDSDENPFDIKVQGSGKAR